MVVGSRAWLERAIRHVGGGLHVHPIAHPGQADPHAHIIPCLDPTGDPLEDVDPARSSGAREGRRMII